MVDFSILSTLHFDNLDFGLGHKSDSRSNTDPFDKGLIYRRSQKDRGLIASSLWAMKLQIS